LHHAAQAAEVHVDGALAADSVEPRAQFFATSKQRLGRSIVENLPHGGQAASHGPCVVFEGAGMNESAGAVAIEEIHHVAAPAECAKAHAARHIFSQRGEVRRDASASL